MGNTNSVPTSETSKATITTPKPENSITKQQSLPIETPGKRNSPIVSDSLVTGSPLGLAEQDSVDISSWFMTKQRKDSFDVDGLFNSRIDFVQPDGERSFENSSRIVHAFGGLKPLANLDNNKTIPVIIVWSQPAKVVSLTGTFNGWQKKIRLYKSVDDFSTIIDMPPGKHQFKFIVDDEWKCSEDLPTTKDADGNIVNELEILDEEGRSIIDGLQDISLEGNPDLEPGSPPTSYNCEIPELPKLNLNAMHDSPPLLPAQLQKTILNNRAIPSDESNLLSIPNHVSVNHLYACSIRDGVMAIASTQRYKKKVC